MLYAIRNDEGEWWQGRWWSYHAAKAWLDKTIADECVNIEDGTVIELLTPSEVEARERAAWKEVFYRYAGTLSTHEDAEQSYREWKEGK